MERIESLLEFWDVQETTLHYKQNFETYNDFEGIFSFFANNYKHLSAKLLSDIFIEDSVTLTCHPNFDDEDLISVKSDSSEEIFNNFNDKINGFVSDLEPEQKIDLTVRINKKNNCLIYIYGSIDDFFKNKSLFFEEVNNRISLCGSINFVNKAFTTPIELPRIVFSNDIRDSFIPKTSEIIPNSLEEKASHCIGCAENIFITPFDFAIPDSLVNSIIKDCCQNSVMILSIMYLADYTSLDKTDELNFILNYKFLGLKSNSYQIEFNKINYNNELYDLFSWVYTNEKTTDRIDITRNILGMLEKPLTDFNKKSFDTIKSNYRIYIKENVEKYITVKNMLTEQILSINDSIERIIDGLANDYKKIFYLFSSVFASIILLNSVQNANVQTYIKEISILCEVFLVFSIIWISVEYHDSKQKVKQKTDLINKIKSNYDDVLTKDQIEEMTDNLSINNNVQKKYFIIMVVFIVILILFTGSVIYKTLGISA